MTRSKSSSRARSTSTMRTDDMIISSKPTGIYKNPKIHPKGLSLAARLYRLEEMNSRVEKKYIINGPTTTSININGGAPKIILLNGLTRNTTIQSRIGDMVSYTSAMIRWKFFHTINVPKWFRLLVVVDNEPNKTTLTGSELFDVSNPTATSDFSFNNTDFMKRFTILHDYQYNFSSSNYSTTTTGMQQTGQIKLQFKNRPVRSDYSGGNAGTIADLVSGAIYLVCYQDSPDATNLSSLVHQSTLYFNDN